MLLTSEAMKGHETIVMAAVARNGLALEYASDEMKNNAKDFHRRYRDYMAGSNVWNQDASGAYFRDRPKPPKWTPTGSQKSTFWGVRAAVKIKLPLGREHNSQVLGPPGTCPRRKLNSEPPSDRVPELTFEPPSRPLIGFCRVLVDLAKIMVYNI